MLCDGPGPDFILNSGPALLNFNFSNPYSDSTIALVYNNNQMIDLYELSPDISQIELPRIRRIWQSKTW